MHLGLPAFLFVAAFATAATAADVPLHAEPDRAITPGVALVGVTPADICRRGYARRARHVPRALKTAVFLAYGLPGNYAGYCSGRRGCVVDHLVSLELGGANDLGNLWPEPGDGRWNARVKDRLEGRLHRLVCIGALPLADAQHAIAADWIAAYRLYVGKRRPFRTARTWACAPRRSTGAAPVRTWRRGQAGCRR